MGSLTRDIMNHLMDEYGKSTVADIDMKKKDCQEPLNTLQPIYVFFKIINDREKYASKANNLFNLTQVLQMA